MTFRGLLNKNLVREDGDGGWERVYWREIFLGGGLGMSKLLAGGGGLSSIPTVGKILGRVVENIEFPWVFQK